MTAVSFTTIAQPNPGGVLFVEIPETVVKKLGAGKRVPVRVTLNGAKYRSTIAVYGGRYYLPARKEVRDAAKLVPGGRARVSLEVDTAARTVDVPADLARALTSARLRPAFDGLSFSRRREFVESVTSAKRPETRLVRIQKVVAQVRAKARAVSPK
ncbi:MAG: YdeI/OmpD-associated family protein [Chloroflexota bacterium]|nr:YdeI/OmpD-associated family protein [Chloroflexota bacterium]